MSLIFDIKRYSVNDGPGIRITLFFKGCPLSCVWCHNPEGISVKQEKIYTARKCIGCMSCIDACQNNALSCNKDKGIQTISSKCILCGECEKACPTRAMEISGKSFSVNNLMKEIQKETAFFDHSEGGVTFCGGEPLLHPEILKELLTRCGEQGIHRAVDTSLYAKPEIVQSIMPETDLFLIDLKLMDSSLHKKYTGVANELILSNIKMIAEAGKDFFIRIPLIEGVNADEGNIRKSADFLNSLFWKRRHVQLLPYHDIGVGKHFKRGTTYNPENHNMQKPLEETQENTIRIFKSYNIKATIGG